MYYGYTCEKQEAIMLNEESMWKFHELLVQASY